MSCVVPTAHRPVGFWKALRDPPSRGLSFEFFAFEFFAFELFAQCEDLTGAGRFQRPVPGAALCDQHTPSPQAVAFCEFNFKFVTQQLTAHALNPQSVNWESPASSLRGFPFQARCCSRASPWLSRRPVSPRALQARERLSKRKGERPSTCTQAPAAAGVLLL